MLCSPVFEIDVVGAIIHVQLMRKPEGEKIEELAFGYTVH